MMYVKLIDNNIEFPPVNKLDEGIMNYNLDTERLIADGYKPLTEVERPETNRYYHIEYTESEDTITEVIVYDETQEEADAREAQERQEYLATLSLTKREVFLALYHDKGITPEQLRSQITTTEALIEFDYAERYYRGNPLISLIGATLGYSEEDLDYLFENKELPQNN